jgi:hypothetical protein
MKSSDKFVLTSVFAAVAIILFPAEARSAQALVDQGDTTFDPNTGLVWLDLRFTQGRSYNSILNGSGNFTTSLGYRFASANEVTQLFLDAGATSIGFPSQPPISVNVPAAQQALSLLGCTLAMSDINRSWMFYDPASDPGLPTPYHVPTAVFGEGVIGGGYPGREGFFLVPGLYPGRDSSSPEWASALVRAVPEPASPLLLCVGAALLWASRKGWIFEPDHCSQRRMAHSVPLARSTSSARRG